LKPSLYIVDTGTFIRHPRLKSLMPYILMAVFAKRHDE
jgi:hypothetical protein